MHLSLIFKICTLSVVVLATIPFNWLRFTIKQRKNVLRDKICNFVTKMNPYTKIFLNLLLYSRTSLNLTPLIRKICDPDIKFKEWIFYALLFSVNTVIRIPEPDKKYRERSINPEVQTCIWFFFSQLVRIIYDCVNLVACHSFLVCLFVLTICVKSCVLYTM